jgi:hypothetical protein
MSNITVALSEKAVKELFEKVRDTIHISKSGSSSGTFSASYNAGIRVEGGTIDFKNSPDEIRISELDVVYDPLSVNLCVDIPEKKIGGFCILWIPIKGCIVHAPEISLFSASPDINIPINLSGLIESEISGGFGINIKYFDNPANAALNVYQAHKADLADKWRFHLDPRWLDLDIIDISDTVGNILDSIVNTFINGVFGGLPGWAKDILSYLLGGMVDIVRGILDIGDDIDEWISDLLGTGFGLFDFILTEVGNYFANKYPLYELENPYPILPGDPPVLLQISNFTTDITDDEIILMADV